MAKPRRVIASIAVLASLFVAACVTPPPEPPPPPTVAVLTLTADAGVNPAPSGRPSPLRVTVFQLAATGGFEAADYFALADQPGATLAADLRGTDEVILQPGASETLTRELPDGVTALGIVAHYRDLDRAIWRATAQVPANQTTGIRVTLQPLAVVVGASAATGS